MMPIISVDRRVLVAVIVVIVLIAAFLVMRSQKAGKEQPPATAENAQLNPPTHLPSGRAQPLETLSEFKDESNWEAFDAGNIDGMQTKGYFGAVFDGRYVYYVPNRMKSFHGVVMRYDTSGDFDSADSYEAYNAAGTDGLNSIGFSDGVFDGRYVYLVPFSNANGVRHAIVLRFDTQAPFKSASSWAAFDAETIGAGEGYDGAVFDGRYVYFVPFGYTPMANSKVLRLDTQGDFKSSGSWSVYDAEGTDGLHTKGFYGGGFDGKHVYFVPYDDGTADPTESEHGRVLRYDSTAIFSSPNSWEAYDAGSTDGMKTIGYKGAVFDGRYMYFVPYREAADVHGRVLRYDTTQGFKNAGSWSAFDASDIDGLDNRGYVGGVFDGKYVYFIPYSYDKSVYHSNFLRYDTSKGFKDGNAWEAVQHSNIGGLPTQGYKYGTIADGYIYFSPYGKNPTSFHGVVLRYKF